MFDILIKNGTVIDGSDSPRARLDVGITGGKITAVDNLAGAEAGHVIDAAGLVVAPGFIDIHSHADYSLLALPTADSKTRQGVTTEVVGNCGISTAPLSPAMQLKGDANSLLGAFGLSWDWDTFASFYDRLRASGTAVNVVPLVGHGTIREKNMGMSDKAPTPEQFAAMQADVREAMRDGAWGISTGLIYPPNVYARTDEIADLAKTAAELGGIYTSHVRGEGATVFEAVGEAIEVGRRAGIRVEVSHFKAENRANWYKMRPLVDMIEAAQERGVNVKADMYPYNAFCTVLSSMMPPWSMAGGKEAALARLKDPAVRKEIAKGLASDALDGEPGYWEGVMITYATGRPEYQGRSVRSISDEQHKSPEDAFMDILLESSLDAGVVVFAMDEDNIEYGLARPYVSIGSDGEGRAAEGPLSKSMPHPRNYGTFPRVLGYYCRERKVFPLETAVYKMTGLQAEKLGLKDRGLVRAGCFADLTLFNPDTVIDKATFSQPHQYPEGIEYVLVNGSLVIENGKHTRALPGKVLAR